MHAKSLHVLRYDCTCLAEHYPAARADLGAEATDAVLFSHIRDYCRNFKELNKYFYTNCIKDPASHKLSVHPDGFYGCVADHATENVKTKYDGKKMTKQEKYYEANLARAACMN